MVRLWNTQTSRCVKTYKGHVNRTYSLFVDFLHGGKHVMCGSEDCRIYLWDLQTRQIAQVLEGHRGKFLHPFKYSIKYLMRLVPDVVLAVAVSVTYLLRRSLVLTRHFRVTPVAQS